MAEEVGKTIYCTVVAQNYLPQALALYASVREVEPDKELVILVVDGERADLEEERPGLRIESVDFLGIGRRDLLELAAIYDVVEFSTAIKPLFFKALLEEASTVVYLDPDMMLVTPLEELSDLVAEHGIVLTPHFLHPISEPLEHITEGHDLTVGIFNLGFCAVGRAAVPFLEWWWSHLERECLIYPLLGVFVDQKWVDVGANFFDAHSLRHGGYNIGPWNLHERHFSLVNGEHRLDSGDPVRLMHFSGFDPTDPEAISVRLSVDLRQVGEQAPALSSMSRKYADLVLAARGVLGPTPEYGFARDASGRKLTKRTRRTYRRHLLEMPDGRSLPSPFLGEEVARFHSWKRRAIGDRIGLTLGDAAIATKYAFPDEFSNFKKRVPGFTALRRRLLDAGRVRR